jgi:DNA-binding transcriptional ArsR family regulator
MRTLRAAPEVSSLAAAKLKALAHPLRLRIVAVLSETETHVNALAAELAVPQSVVSQHLRILRMEGLVDLERKDGFSVYHLLEPRIVDLLTCIESCKWQ